MGGDPTGGVPDRQGPYGAVWETPQEASRTDRGRTGRSGGPHRRRPGPTGAVRGGLGDPTGGVPDRQGPYGALWGTPQEASRTDRGRAGRSGGSRRRRPGPTGAVRGALGDPTGGAEVAPSVRFRGAEATNT